MRYERGRARKRTGIEFMCNLGLFFYFFGCVGGEEII